MTGPASTRSARRSAGGHDLAESPPLHGVRVVDLAHDGADSVTRWWADLGADVLRIELAGHADHHRSAPSVNGHSLPYTLRNANKRIAVLNPAGEADRLRFFDSASAADLVVDSGNPGRATAFGTSCRDLADRYPHLVTMSVSDFGLTGPKANWAATDAVLYAMSTALSRSRSNSGAPTLPPEGIATATAAAQAAWAGLAAFYRRLRCGRGEYIDFSRYEAVLQSLDPPFGSQGQAAAARRSGPARRSGGRKQDAYPIFACKDGWVRLCVLAPRQWRGLRAWLGEPAAFQDSKYDSIGARFAAFDEIGRLVAEQFATRTVDELVSAGARFGVPVAALVTPGDVFSIEHFRRTGAFVDIGVAPHTVLTVPRGCMHIGGVRPGLRQPRMSDEAEEPTWTDMRPSPLEVAEAPSIQRPFEGLRVLDLGVIVAGGELGRLFSDLGADVIKVENANYPDGLRQARPGQVIAESFAWTHRNQTSLGLNLRDPSGAEVFRHLVAESDVVLANFKPGTLAALGFSYAELTTINPRIVLAESSAYGDHGPWSTRMGYGPLVRASTGITALWTDDREPGQTPSFCDSTTIFPDHVVARIAATAALALLIRLQRTGTGGHVHVSQAEAAIGQLDHVYAAEAAEQRGMTVIGDTAIHEVVPAMGDDQWFVISIRDDADWKALATVMAAPALTDDPKWRTSQDRWQHRDELRRLLRQWMSDQDCGSVAATLQDAGVPAAPMYRAGDVLDDPQLQSRSLYTEMVHPLLDTPLPTESAPALFRSIPAAELRPAPMLGQHTRQICRSILGLTDDRIDQLISGGALSEATVRDVQQESIP